MIGKKYLSCSYVVINSEALGTSWWNPPSNVGHVGSIPGQGSKIPHTSWPKNQNEKQKQYGNKLNKDSKNGPQQNKIFKLVEEILKAKQRDHKIKKKKKTNLQNSLSVKPVDNTKYLPGFTMTISNEGIQFKI